MEISAGTTHEVIEHMSAAVQTKSITTKLTDRQANKQTNQQKTQVIRGSCWAERVVVLQVHRFTLRDRQALARLSIYDLPATVLWRITSC